MTFPPCGATVMDDEGFPRPCGAPTNGRGVTLTINDADVRLADGQDARIPLCDAHHAELAAWQDGAGSDTAAP